MTERIWHLRAMNVAELLDETIRLYRHNFLVFIGITALLQLPMSILSMVLTAPLNAREEASSMTLTAFYLYAGAAILVSILNYLVFYNLVSAALARAISNRYLGEPVSIVSAYRSILGRFWSLLGAVTLLSLAYLLAVVPLALVALVPCAGLLLAPLAAGLSILISVRLAFAVQAVVLENMTARQALRRSWDLVEGYGWRTAGILFVLGLFSLLIVSGPSYAITYGLQALAVPPAVRLLASGVLEAVLSAFYMPVRSAGTTLLYYDLRIRGEALDLELQAKALSENAVQPVLDVTPLDILALGVRPQPTGPEKDQAGGSPLADQAGRYHDEGRLEEAIEAYRAAIAGQPDDASLHNDLGLALHESGDLDGAIDEFWQAANLDPDHPTAHYNLALAYRDRGDLRAAREALATYLRLEPDPRLRAAARQDSGLMSLVGLG